MKWNPTCSVEANQFITTSNTPTMHASNSNVLLLLVPTRIANSYFTTIDNEDN